MKEVIVVIMITIEKSNKMHECERYYNVMILWFAKVVCCKMNSMYLQNKGITGSDVETNAY